MIGSKILVMLDWRKMISKTNCDCNTILLVFYVWDVSLHMAILPNEFSWYLIFTDRNVIPRKATYDPHELLKCDTWGFVLLYIVLDWYFQPMNMNYIYVMYVASSSITFASLIATSLDTKKCKMMYTRNVWVLFVFWEIKYLTWLDLDDGGHAWAGYQFSYERRN